MKRITYLFILLVFPLGVFAQWNTNLSENLSIAPNSGSSNISNHYSNNGYFFSYDENSVYKVHRYNTDGTPNWTSSMLPNNRNVGFSTFTKYTFLDTSGNLIHISSFLVDGINIRYCATKISPTGDQLWNGSSGIEINSFVLGAYISPSDDLYLALGDKTLHKYNSSGVLQWSTTFAGESLSPSNVSIIEKTDGTIGVVFMSLVNFNNGNYYYSVINTNGTLINTVQIENELCNVYQRYKLLGDANNNLYFLFTDENDKGHIQKITSNAPVLPGNGLDIDSSTSHASIFQSAIIKNGELNILYNYYEIVNGSIGIMNQKVNLNTFTTSYANGNILLDCNTNNVFTLPNEMKSFGNDFGFLVLDNNTKNISFKVFDGSTVTQSQNVCTTTSVKGLASVSTLNNISPTNSQVVILFTDDRNNDFEHELYSQNILFGFLGIDEEAEIAIDIMIYPNPAKSILYIKNIENIKSIDVYNSTGQFLSTISNFDKIDVSNWSNGVYYFNILLENNQSLSKKIIKK
jgi:hypothetical protein